MFNSSNVPTMVKKTADRHRFFFHFKLRDRRYEQQFFSHCEMGLPCAVCVCVCVCVCAERVCSVCVCVCGESVQCVCMCCYVPAQGTTQEGEATQNLRSEA